MAAITNVNTGYSPPLFSSSFNPRRLSFTKPSCFLKPSSFKPLPSNSLSISSSTLKIKTLSIRSSPPFASKSYCVNNKLSISKLKSPVETVIPSHGPIVRMLRTGFVGAVTAVAVFFFARFSQPQALAERMWSTVENAEKSDVVKSLLDKMHDCKYAEADEILEEMLRIQPEVYEWKSYKGLVLALHYEDYLSAKLLFLDMINTSPLRCEGYGALVAFVTDEELPIIKRLIDRAFESAKDDGDLRDFKSLYAQYHTVAREYDEALRLLDELILENPKDYAPYMLKGALLVSRLNRKEEGDECFEKSLSLARKRIHINAHARRLVDKIAQIRTDAHSINLKNQVKEKVKD